MNTKKKKTQLNKNGHTVIQDGGEKGDGNNLSAMNDEKRRYDENSELRKLMLDQFKCLQRTQNRMLSEIEQMKTTLERHGLSTNGYVNTSSISKSTNKGKFEDIMWSLVPRFHDVFDLEFLRLVAGGTVFKLSKDEIIDSNYIPIDVLSNNCSNIALVLMFSVKPEEQKSETDKGVRPKFS